MAIIFRVMQLDETSQGEGRMGEKRPGLSSSTGRSGKEGDLPGHWRETWGVQCPKARRRCFKREGAVRQASCCWEIKSDDRREATSAFGNAVTTGDIDHENMV